MKKLVLDIFETCSWIGTNKGHYMSFPRKLTPSRRDTRDTIVCIQCKNLQMVSVMDFTGGTYCTPLCTDIHSDCTQLYNGHLSFDSMLRAFICAILCLPFPRSTGHRPKSQDPFGPDFVVRTDFVVILQEVQPENAALNLRKCYEQPEKASVDTESNKKD